MRLIWRKGSQCATLVCIVSVTVNLKSCHQIAHPSFRKPKFQEAQVSGSPSVRKPKFQEAQVSGSPSFRKPKFQEAQVSGKSSFRKSKLQERPKLPSSIGDDFICCYEDPTSNGQRIGRPFINNNYIKDHWAKYMNNKKAMVKDHHKAKIPPQLVTACSSNHFTEHKEHMLQVKKYFPGQKIVIYDLGLSDYEIRYIKNQTYFYIYEKFDFDKWPWHVRILNNFAWKIIIWMETLQKYKAIQYFDTSIWFKDSNLKAIQEKAVRLNSCWIYYIKMTGHDITSHLHPGMHSFFPTDYMKQMEGAIAPMYMAGAVIIYNTDFCKENILKWAFLCALTRDCIAPLGSMKGCNKPNHYMYFQKMYRKDKHEMPYLTEEGLTKESKPVIYQMCHRFDQGLLSLLWTNQLNYNFTSVFLGKDDTDIKFASLLRSKENSLTDGSYKISKKFMGNEIGNLLLDDRGKVITDVRKIKLEGFSN